MFLTSPLIGPDFSPTDESKKRCYSSCLPYTFPGGWFATSSTVLIALGILVCFAVIYTSRVVLRRGFRSATAKVAVLCSGSLAAAFLFFLIVLIDPAAVLKVLRTDLTAAMVVGAVAMGSTAVVSLCAALVCVIRRVEGWTKVFLSLVAACAGQGSAMFYLLFLH